MLLPIHEMLSRTAQDHPGKEALVFRSQRLSFSQLERKSTRLAHFLRANGIAPGMRVGIYSSKCADEVTALFAIAKTGGVLVHINPAFRDEKLRHVITECELTALFFHESKSAAITRMDQQGALPNLLISFSPNENGNRNSATALPVHPLETILEDPRWAGEPDLRIKTADDDPAAIIYTSGTTASSKGIIVTHRIFSESTVISAQVLENVPQDRLISITPFSFDGALSQLFTATLVGGTLVLQDSNFPRDVVRTLVSEQITGFHAMPSFWRMMLERYPSFAQHEFPQLRYLSLIGEVFPQEELARLKRILKHTKFFMMYGTTEAFRSTCLPPADFSRKSSSVGKPLPGVEIRVVDEKGNDCAPGEVGEIVHRGIFVSPGYWKRGRGATFRDDGVHTGDLGRFDDEGYLYFVGRKDTMIKRLGYQIYPEEIEKCLDAIDGVAMAAVVCSSGNGNGQSIRAFLVPKPGSSLTSDAVTKYCKHHLPAYMMPDDISFRSALPITGTCKVDRSQLRLSEGL